MCPAWSYMRCNSKGQIVTTHGDGYAYECCGKYKPMPDVESLMKLANEMSVEKGDIWGWRRRIREALGVES